MKNRQGHISIRSRRASAAGRHGQDMAVRDAYVVPRCGSTLLVERSTVYLAVDAYSNLIVGWWVVTHS
jgi:hypothetical protein